MGVSSVVYVYGLVGRVPCGRRRWWWWWRGGGVVVVVVVGSPLLWLLAGFQATCRGTAGTAAGYMPLHLARDR